MIFFRKNTLKNDISGIIETAHIHPRKYGISCDRKIKNDRKVQMIFCTFMETFIGVCFPIKKQDLIYKTEI